jgi:tripartite-type tricarboxylate transporter receptor subunit TctC
MQPGGGSDIAYRMIQPALSKELGVEVQIEYKPGPSSQEALMDGLKRTPDGYTVMHVHQTQVAASLFLQKAPYKIDDFAVATTINYDPSTIAVAKTSPINSLTDLINEIKKNPTKVSVGATRGTASYAFLNWLKARLKLEFNIIPYSGGGPAKLAAIGGHVTAAATSAGDIYGNIQSLKAISVGGEKEISSMYPGVQPAYKELEAFGIKKDELIDMPSWRALAFPKEFKEKYPDRFNFFVEAYNRAYNSAEYKELVKKNNAEGIGYSVTPEVGQKDLLEINKIFEKALPYLN